MNMNFAADVKLEMVPLDRLVAHPDNPRVVMREDVIDSIARQIGEAGFKVPHGLLVRPLADGNFQIISGHHRHAAAVKAGLESVPCFIEEMDDEAAFMALVLSNTQGELSPLEIGIHAFKFVPLAKAGRGKTGGVSEYAESIGMSNQRVFQLRDAAEVYSQIKNLQIDLGISDSELLGKATHLTQINASPRDCWPLLVAMLSDDAMTVAKIKDKATKLKDLYAAIPDWWRTKIDFPALAQMVLANEKVAERRTKAFCYAAETAASLGVATIYRHDDTGLTVDRNGRVFRILKAAPEEYDAAERFKESVIGSDIAPDIDRLREIYQNVISVVERHSSSADKFEPALTDEEFIEQKKRAEMRAREAERDALARRIYHGDCRDGLRQWQGQKIRLLMTDPPYGMDFQSNRRVVTEKAAKIAGDADAEAASKLLAEVLEAAVPHMAEDSHAVVFCHDESLFYLRRVIEDAGLTVKRILVWVKPNHTSGDLFGSFAPRKELAIHAVKGSPDVSPRHDDVYVQASFPKESSHPTEKPVEVLSYWMESLTDEGDLVVDPFAGTGATLVAAEKLRRRWWGAELDSDYRDEAILRVQEAADGNL